MDTSDSSASAEGRGSTSPTLTSLDRTQDNFESLLLLLLQSHTVQSKSPTESATPIPTALRDTGISGEALGTLSSEQITTLITSNSVNYEVIQQILAQQKGRSLGPGGRDLAAARDQNGEIWREGGETEKERDFSLYSRKSALSPSCLRNNRMCAGMVFDYVGDLFFPALVVDLTGRCSKSPTPLRSPSSSSSPPNLVDTNQQLQQLIQISPEQLHSLQMQVNQLLQSQHLSLPADLSPEQQQQLNSDAASPPAPPPADWRCWHCDTQGWDVCHAAAACIRAGATSRERHNSFLRADCGRCSQKCGKWGWRRGRSKEGKTCTEF